MRRIAAIGDTHLGRLLFGYDLTPDILRTMYAFHGMCVARKVDMAIHLGDVFDRPTPIEYHRKAFVQWCNLFERSGIPLRVLVGNHDAMGRVGAASALEAFKVCPWGVVEMIDRPTVEGNVLLLPWPSASIYDNSEDWLLDVLTAQQKLRPGATAFAHLMPSGATIGDQEWVYRGAENVLPPSVVDDSHIDTIVAGHVHRPQEISQGIWTSGSAIRLRFDEARQPRYFVEVTDGALRLVRHNHAPMLREMAVDASDWGTGGCPPSTADVIAKVPGVVGQIVKVVPYVDSASIVDWVEVEASLYKAGAVHVSVATPIQVKREVKKSKRKVDAKDVNGSAGKFIIERVPDKAERKVLMRMFKQLRAQVDG